MRPRASAWAVAVALLLLLLAAPASPAAFTAALEGGGEVVSGGSLVLSVRGGGGVYGYVITVRHGGKTVYSVEGEWDFGTPLRVVLEASWGPGVYTVEVVLSREGAVAYREALPLYVAPTAGEVDELAVKVGMAASGDEAAALVERLHRLYMLVEAGLLREAASEYEGIARDLGTLGGAEGFAHRVLMLAEEWLTFENWVSLAFWLRFVGIVAMFLLVAVPLLPLVFVDHVVWVSYVRERFGVAGDVAQLVWSRVSDLMLRADGLSAFGAREVALTFAGAAIASIGITTNNVVTIIGSMLVSPVLILFTAASAGWSLYGVAVEEGDRLLTGSIVFEKSLVNGVKAVVLVVLTSAAIYAASSTLVPLTPTEQFLLRTRPNYSDLVVALSSGLAAAVAVSAGREDISVLIGSGIAVALIPPAAVVGISLSMGSPEAFVGSLSLLVTNIIAVLAAGYLVFRIHILSPALEGAYAWVDHTLSQARTLAEKAFIFITEVVWELVTTWAEMLVRHTGQFGGRRVLGTLRGIVQLLKVIITPFAVAAAFILILSPPAKTLILLPTGLMDLAAAALATALTPLSLAWVARPAAAAVLVAAAAVAARLARARLGGGRIGVYGAAAYVATVTVLHLLGLTRYPASATLTAVVAAAAAALASYASGMGRRGRARVFLMAFLTFVILFLTFQSLVAFRSQVYVSKLATLDRVVEAAVAARLGVALDRVSAASRIEGPRVVATVTVYWPASRLGELGRMPPLRGVEETVGRYLGVPFSMKVVFVLTP